MSWNETLYRLHETVGGEFFGSARPEEDTERPAPDAVLVLPWRSTRLPLHILVQPVRHVEQADTLRPTLHTVETRTDLFPRFSDVLRPRPEDDLLLLERLVEAGKAAYDAAADVRL